MHMTYTHTHTHTHTRTHTHTHTHTQIVISQQPHSTITWCSTLVIQNIFEIHHALKLSCVSVSTRVYRPPTLTPPPPERLFMGTVHGILDTLTYTEDGLHSDYSILAFKCSKKCFQSKPNLVINTHKHVLLYTQYSGGYTPYSKMVATRKEKKMERVALKQGHNLGPGVWVE